MVELLVIKKTDVSRQKELSVITHEGDEGVEQITITRLWGFSSL